MHSLAAIMYLLAEHFQGLVPILLDDPVANDLLIVTNERRVIKQLITAPVARDELVGGRPMQDGTIGLEEGPELFCDFSFLLVKIGSAVRGRTMCRRGHVLELVEFGEVDFDKPSRHDRLLGAIVLSKALELAGQIDAQRITLFDKLERNLLERYRALGKVPCTHLIAPLAEIILGLGGVDLVLLGRVLTVLESGLVLLLFKVELPDIALFVLDDKLINGQRGVDPECLFYVVDGHADHGLASILIKIMSETCILTLEATSSFLPGVSFLRTQFGH